MKTKRKRKKRTRKLKTVIIPDLPHSRPTPLPSHFRQIACVVVLGLFLASLVGNGSAQDKSESKPYALIFGTVWSPEKQPVYGVKVTIRRADQKKPKWELRSDHRGEFAQRVPAGEADYLVTVDLKGIKSPDGKQLRLAEDVKMHISNDERTDIGLHLTY